MFSVVAQTTLKKEAEISFESSITLTDQSGVK